MALSAGQSVGGGDYLDFKELAAAGPIVCVFRIREFSAPEPMDYGTVLPVVADVLVCDGEHRGEVYLSERIIGAPTGPLRGSKNPTRQRPEILEPTNQVGAELVYRVEVIERRGVQPFVALQKPSAGDMTTAGEVHDEGRGWTPRKTAAPAPVEEEAPAASNELAGAGVGANGRPRPFGG